MLNSCVKNAWPDKKSVAVVVEAQIVNKCE